MKKSQLIMIWLLPVIIIGGVFFPVLGYLVIAMMGVLMVLAYFKKGRYWCWNLCPRGAFLDGILSKSSLGKSSPVIFRKQGFRWLVFVLFISLLIFRISRMGGSSIIAIGMVFVSMCLVTTIIAVILGVLIKHRGWCMICPMGTLQEKIAKLNRKEEK